MRLGVRLGIDVGKTRIGVARCDAHGLLATPLETVMRDLRHGTDVRRICELLSEYGATEIIVGHPLGLSGNPTPSTEDAVQFARLLATACTVDVRLVDERLSTTQAQGQLRAAGKDSRGSRNIIDQAAAVVILQHALDMERARGEAPGELVERSGERA